MPTLLYKTIHFAHLFCSVHNTTMAARRQSVSIQEEDAFKLVIDELMEEVVWHPILGDSEVETWLLKMVDYNVLLGKQLRGRGVISAFKSFLGPASKPDLKPIYILGWCMELFAASFYIAEDIIRRSIVRRSQSCWHLVKDVGKFAIRDPFLLQGIMNFIIDKHFTGHPCHMRILQLFPNCFFNTSLAQNFDFRIVRMTGLSGFTMENYNHVARYKAGYFTFYLPMTIGKIMSEPDNPSDSELKLIEEISKEMGQLYLTQDDYIDCFGNREASGRFGSKIETNCCTWFIIKALNAASPQQEKILRDHYGKPGTDNVHRVIKMFKELDLIQKYRRYEMKCYKSIMQKIANLPDSVPALYFSETLAIIMKREK